MKELFSTVRPKTLLAALSPVIIGTALAYNHNSGINILIAVLTVMSATFMQAAANVLNDYYDHRNGIDTLDRIGPRRISANDSGKSVAIFGVVLLVLGFISGIYLMVHGGYPIIVVGISAIIISVLYTGGPYPLAYFYLGEPLAFLFFGPVAVSGTYYLQTGSIGNSLIFGITPGLITTAIMAVNNTRDIETDSKAHKKTISILIGEKLSRHLCVLLPLLGCISCIYVGIIAKLPLLMLPALLFIPFYKLWRNLISCKDKTFFNDALEGCGKFLFATSMITSIVLLCG